MRRSVIAIALFLLAQAAVAQDCDPPFLACTAPAAMGQPTVQEDFVTDLTYRGTLQQVWAVEPQRPGFNSLTLSRFTVFNEDLQTGRASFNAGFPEPVFGIAEIPPTHPNGGNAYVLTPDANAQAGLDPRIGIMDNAGNLLPEGAFTAIVDPSTSAAPPGFFTGIDVNPAEGEIALLDDGRATAGGTPHLVFVDLNYRVLRGPFPVEGRSSFYGGGIAYSSQSAVLVVSHFRTAFESYLALEYDRTTGVYTGRSVRMDHFDPLTTPIALGLDTGFFRGDPSLYFYNVTTDAAYALRLNEAAFAAVPGPVGDLSPYCLPDDSGQVVLAWNNHPGYDYDSIVVVENGVEVAVLDSSATQYRSPYPISGKVEYCLETRSGGSPNFLRVCCEGESAGQLPFIPVDQLPASRVDVDPLTTNPHFQLDVACPRVVGKKEDFRMYVVGSYDNQIRVVDHNRQLLPLETIPTTPPQTSKIQGSTITDLAATGIALIDVELDGQKVPMYALLDFDGPGNFIARASVHFLKDTVLPSDPARTIRAGTRFQDLPTIDLGNGQNGRFLVAWDSDESNDLITLDSEARSILRIRYDPAAGTMRMISEAPLPLAGLTPFPGLNFPIGGISVLPSGNYLVAGGDTFESTISRAFLVTPFLGDDPANPDPRSVKLVGYVEGLLSFSELFRIEVLGRKVGPDLSFGLETVFFSEEGPGGQGAGGIFYNFPHYFPPGIRSVQGNFMINLASPVAHPRLAAEPLEDLQTTVAGLFAYETDPLTPGFSNDLPAIDFHYHLFNPSPGLDLAVKVRVFLDGTEVTALGEQVRIPAGRSLYRRTGDRSEKTIQLRIENPDPGARPLRVLVGATGIRPSGTSGPVFRRGDPDQSGIFDLTDPIFILNYMFLAGPEPGCLDAADADDSGLVDLTDPIFLLNRLFQGGPLIPPPGQETCGPDPTADDLAPCVVPNC